MPRRPRAFVDGAVYHVCCRVARGEPVLAEREEARRLVGVVREVRERDGLSILAWCVMPGHYHLALRTGQVPLWRSMRLIQGRSALSFCRRWGVPGPLWQGRYQARLVWDPAELSRLVAWVHLVPVAAGLARDPAGYRWSGHGELLGRRRPELVDLQGTLALFGDTADASRLRYLAAIRATRGESWLREAPGGLPWWPRRGDEGSHPSWRRGDTAGPAGARCPEALSCPAFLARALPALGRSLAELGGRRKAAAVSRERERLVLVGVERFGVAVGALAASLGMNPGSVSRLLGRAGARRVREAAFALQCRDLEAAVETAAAPGKGSPEARRLPKE